MRFIFNFVLFGLLFFIIWKFFPEGFQQLLLWVTKLYDFLAGLVQSALEKMNYHPSGSTKPAVDPSHPEHAMLLMYLSSLLKR